MENRKRNKQLIVRFTEKEYEYIKYKKEKSHLGSYADFIYEAVVDCNIYYVDTSPILKFAEEINKLGVNVNQIAKIANETNNIYKNDIDEIKEKISAIQKFINDTHTKLLKVRRGAY